MPEPVEGTGTYLAGLDGIRAIAVLAVIAYHLGVGAVPGGLLGVGVFFVLSGYLITDLLVAEHRRTGGIGFRRFWARRARRLLPALGVMLLATATWVTLFDRIELAQLRSDLPSVLLYLSNWWFIFHHVSYFARFGPPSPLGHLWSLAIEEQFYLVAPALLLVGLHRLRSRRVLVGAVLALAVASAVEMALLYSPNGDPTRVYDGTDTRAFALLVGVALALVWPRSRASRPLPPAGARALQVGGIVSLAGILVMFWQVGQYDPFLYQGGMALLAVLTAVVIAATVHGGSWLHRALGVGPLRWIGVRSYGIYLWHYPVIVLTTPVDAGPDAWRATAQVGASIVLAALSWRFVEQPVRHGALGRMWGRTRHAWDELRHERTLASVSRTAWAAGTATLVAGTVSVAGLSGLVNGPALAPAPQATAIMPAAPRRAAPPPTVPEAPVQPPAGSPPTPSSAATGPAPSGPGTSAADPAGSAGPATSAPAGTSAAPGSGSGSGPAAPQAGAEVTAIGDSVLVDAAPYLQKLLPGIAIDAKVGQQLYQVPPTIPTLRALGAVRPVVIIELGTNGPYSAAQLVDLLDSLGPPRHVVLVNTRVPRPWEQQVNDTIAAVARTFPNASLVDWYAASATHPDDFYPDGVHLDPAGAQYYADLLASAVDRAQG